MFNSTLDFEKVWWFGDSSDMDAPNGGDLEDNQDDDAPEGTDYQE